ncbi:MAG TPA: sugar phosphate isomerase/epimerase [Flavisolibacter sp.]|nr:sugar phosphate isomerase/epimerase [Flavisolibacter sp.]
MTYNRRSFIKTLGITTAGIAFTNLLPACGAASKSNNQSKDFGLQLYTLRDVLPADPKGILTQIASFGYKQIESYEGEKGMFWGMKNTEFKGLMDNLGMKIISSHCDINKDFERKAAEAAEIGMSYLICPWLGPQKSLDDFKRFADTFNQRGEICRKNGIRFAYHNHDYSFLPLEGKLPQDVMMQATDKNLVDYEMDIYWVVAAGQDPATWMAKYPGRFRLCHVKDRKKGAAASDKDASVTLGTGGIDFKKLLQTSEAKDLQYRIVEQEAYANTTPIEAVKANADYMKRLSA